MSLEYNRRRIITNFTSQSQKASEYSLVYNILNGNINVSDDLVNDAYNYFHSEKMKYYKNVFTRLDCNFRNRKKQKPNEWNDFASVVKLCIDNKFNIKSYIKYCFLNKLVKKLKGHALSDISYLRNYPQVIEYARNKNEIERLYSIYTSIQKTIILIKRLATNRKTNPKAILKDIISSGKFNEYVTTGSISPFFLSLIPNISLIIHKFVDFSKEDRTVVIDISNGMHHYNELALKAMKMFYPNSANKTMFELCK